MRHYPGSPWIVRHLLKPRDRLSAIELHPRDSAGLKTTFEGDFQVRAIELDGWLALGAHLPPKEKRGVVLIDPPFEAGGEFERLVDGLVRAHKRFSGGIFALGIRSRTGRRCAASSKRCARPAFQRYCGPN